MIVRSHRTNVLPVFRPDFFQFSGRTFRGLSAGLFALPSSLERGNSTFVFVKTLGRKFLLQSQISLIRWRSMSHPFCVCPTLLGNTFLNLTSKPVCNLFVVYLDFNQCKLFYHWITIFTCSNLLIE